MLRRTFVRAGIALACAEALARRPALAHTPYKQWVVYRRKHLLIGCHRQDPGTYVLAQRLVKVLQTRLPDARARIARAPTAGRLASLLGTNTTPVSSGEAATVAAVGAGEVNNSPTSGRRGGFGAMGFAGLALALGAGFVLFRAVRS